MTDMDRRTADLDRRLDAWLTDGPTVAPAPFVAATLAPIPSMPQRRRSVIAWGRVPTTVGFAMRLAAVAAVVALAVGLSIGILANVGPVGAPPSPSPSPSPSGLAFADEGLIGANGFDPTRAGTYRTRMFRPQLVFTVPAGWSIGTIVRTFVGGGEQRDVFPLVSGSGEIAILTPSSVDPPAPDAEGSPLPADLARWLAANPNLSLSPARSVTVAGLPAVELEGTLSPTARTNPEDDDYYRPFGTLPLLPRHHVRFQVLTVGGTTVVVATLTNADGWAAFQPLADEVIATFRFAGA